jgi:hypothetical protein
VIENPWCHLPDEAPFVLPGDKERIDEFNERVGATSKSFLQITKLLPEPFIGDPNAPVVLLSNNPGVGKRAHLREGPQFRDRIGALTQPRSPGAVCCLLTVDCFLTDASP